MKKIRVAIADDHRIVRDGIVSMLNAYDDLDVVVSAGNGKELLDLLEKKATVDVCLLDVNMPVMNGYDTLVALKEKYPQMHFLILTQLEHEFIIVRMLKAGAAGYMLKDCGSTELAHAIRTIMEKPYYNNNLVNGYLIGFVTKDKAYDKISLTEREEEFLKLSCSELGYKEIADKMNITPRTAAFYRETLFTKLEVKSRTGLALYALKLGLVPMDHKR